MDKLQPTPTSKVSFPDCEYLDHGIVDFDGSLYCQYQRSFVHAAESAYWKSIWNHKCAPDCPHKPNHDGRAALGQEMK